MPQYRGGKQYGFVEPEPIEPHSFTVLPDGAKSTDYKVKQVQKFAKDMTDKELSKFTKGDTRKTVMKLTTR